MIQDTYTDIVIDSTPPPPQPKRVWLEKAKLCVMYVEFRDLDIIKYNLWNLANVYGGDASLVIVHSKENRETILEITKDWKNVTHQQLYDKSITVTEYSRLFASVEFWNTFSDHEHVLVNQWDSYLFKQIPEKFFKYDYVGGPSGHFYINWKGSLMNICAMKCLCPRCENGDHVFKSDNFKDFPQKWILLNGGFSLRKVQSMIDLCKAKKWHMEPEDVYFCISNLTRPTIDEAKEFGIQDFKYDDPVGCHKIWDIGKGTLKDYGDEYINKLFERKIFGKVYGKFLLEQYLGVTHDNKEDTATLSNFIETYDMWKSFSEYARTKYKNVQLFTMFETNDVHPHIIECMKVFDKVIVPFDYLKEILERHGIMCESLNCWTSELIRSKPKVIKKKPDPERLVFLYNGTNDIRKNVNTLTRVFANATQDTNHLLIVKTNNEDGLTKSKNIKIITDHISNEKLASLFNFCDYCVTCTRGEGVSLLHLEGAYFGKPTISHTQGVFRDIHAPIIPVAYREVPIDYESVPNFLHKVFYGKWWDVVEEDLLKVFKQIISSHN